MIKDHEPRTFRVYPYPSVADPAHMIKLDEITPGREARMTDTTLLENLLSEIRTRSAKEDGRQEEFSKVLSDLGMTYPEYCEFRNSRKKQ